MVVTDRFCEPELEVSIGRAGTRLLNWLLTIDCARKVLPSSADPADTVHDPEGVNAAGRGRREGTWVKKVGWSGWVFRKSEDGNGPRRPGVRDFITIVKLVDEAICIIQSIYCLLECTFPNSQRSEWWKERVFFGCSKGFCRNLHSCRVVLAHRTTRDAVYPSPPGSPMTQQPLPSPPSLAWLPRTRPTHRPCSPETSPADFTSPAQRGFPSHPR